MMAVDVKRLSEGERVFLDRSGAPIETAGYMERRDLEVEITRRGQAMLAGAGESPLPDRRWYVLAVASGHEMSVDNDLRARGAETWLPIDSHRPKRRAGRRRGARLERGEVAFDGYLFVHVCPIPRVTTGLRSTERVLDMIGGWEKPYPVSDSDIKALQAFVAMTPRERVKLEAEMRRDARQISAGMDALVVEGVFKGMRLSVERVGKDAVWGFMAGRVAVTMPLANLAALE